MKLGAARSCCGLSLLMMIGSACKESEAEREDRAMRDAVPIRLRPDGAIKLSDLDQKALGLVVAIAVEGDLSESWTRFGVVVARPEDEAVLAMPLTGRVEKTKGIELGSDVKAGDFIANVVPVLGTVDQVTLASQRAGLEGQIASARSELSGQETELTRSRRLQAEGLASAQELFRLETSVATSKAQLEGLTSARRAYDRGESTRVALRSPVGGRVVFLETAISLTLPAGRTVARILQPGPRWIDIAAPFREPSGARYEVEGVGAWAGARLLSRGAIVADDGLRRDRIELVEQTAADLLPGATVTVRVHGAPAHGALVPESALTATPGGAIIFVNVSPGVYSPRPVKIGGRGEGKVVVTEGVKAGDAIVVRGTAGLRGEMIRSELRHQE